MDGANGDTWLQPVHAMLGQSRFAAKGKIVRILPETLPNGNTKPGSHEIALNVIVNGGRMEDFNGTERDSAFGIDFGRIGHTSPQIPGQAPDQTQ